jgi:hypothetical protein
MRLRTYMLPRNIKQSLVNSIGSGSVSQLSRKYVDRLLEMKSSDIRLASASKREYWTVSCYLEKEQVKQLAVLAEELHTTPGCLFRTAIYMGLCMPYE